MSVDNPKTCSLYLPKKKRYCHFRVSSETSEFCSMHDPELAGGRMACPVDPRHSIFIRDLEKHRAICSKTKDVAKVESQPLFVKNVLGSTSEDVALENVVFSSDEAVYNLRTKLETGYTKLVEDLKGRIQNFTVPASPEGPSGDQPAGKPEGTEVVEKNKFQQTRILEELLESFQAGTDFTGLCVCEFGCGKGGLAARLMEHWTGEETETEPKQRPSQYLLVDREPRRNKKENKYKEELDIVRLRMDIGDLDLSLVNEQKVFKHPVHGMLVIAKHLCGAATDLALKSAERAGMTKRTRLCIATCCHHACTWDSFVGREIFEKLEVATNPDEFAQIRSATGWATAGRAKREKAEIGRLAKTCIDLARCLWIVDRLGLANIQFKEYCDSEVTPENRLILAD